MDKPLDESVGRQVTDVDKFVGQRVRARRMMVGLSQEKLGEHLGLTFQQIQKYEKGVNRISASRLHQIAAALDTPIQFFFCDEGELSHDEATALQILQDRKAAALLKAFSQIESLAVRQALLAHAQALAACSGQGDAVSRVDGANGQ